MANMFCYQCEQTAGGKGCAGTAGVCGKSAETAFLQDKLTGELITLAKVANRRKPSVHTQRLMLEGLFATVTNVNFDGQVLERLIKEVHEERIRLFIVSAKCKAFDLSKLWELPEDIRSLKSLPPSYRPNINSSKMIHPGKYMFYPCSYM